MIGPRNLRRAELLALVFLTALTAGALAPAAPGEEPPPSPRTALASAIARGGDVPAEVLSLGPAVLPAVLSALADGRLTGANGKEIALDGEGVEILFAALGRFPRDELCAAVLAALGDPGPARIRLAAFRVAERLGDAAFVPVLLEAGAPRDGTVALPPEEEEVFTAALAAVLRRHPAAFARLMLAWSKLHRGLRAATIRASGATGLREAATFLETLLDDPFGSLAANEIATVAKGLPATDCELFTAALRARLDRDDPALRQAVALALGRLRDRDSIPGLIEMLAAEEEAEVECALWALIEITGLRFRADRDCWLRWYGQEASWMCAAPAHVLPRLESQKNADVAEAIREIVEHRLYREEFVHHVAAVLEHPSPELRRLACWALGETGSPEAVPALEASLEDKDHGVRTAAASALRKLVPDPGPAKPSGETSSPEAPAPDDGSE